MPTKQTPTATLTLPADALDQAVRALADRGADYGWNVYHRGIPTIATLKRTDGYAFDPEGATSWHTAIVTLASAYRAATGERWTY